MKANVVKSRHTDEEVRKVFSSKQAETSADAKKKAAFPAGKTASREPFPPPHPGKG